MAAGDWIALAGLLVVTGGIGIRMIMKMTRLIDAVTEVGKGLDKIAGIVRDHEARLNRAGL